MKKPLLVLAICLALAGCADVTSSALEINGRSFDRSDINDLLSSVDEEIQEDEGLAVQLASGPGTVSADLSAPVLNLTIQNEVFAQELASRGLDVTQDEIDSARLQSAPTGSATVDGILAQLNARAFALQSAGIDAVQLIADAEVSLDNRYGRWSETDLSVIPNPAAAAEVTGS